MLRTPVLKPIHFFLLLCIIQIPSSAETYYLSNSGNDSLDGLTEQTPWLTIARAGEDVRSGDIILLKRGDVFRESYNLPGGVDVGAYGSAGDALPVVSGSVAITGWTSYGGNIWVADVDRKIRNLFVDNRLMLIARYPNSGWLRLSTGEASTDGSHTVITSDGFADNPRDADGYWTGANMRWRRWSWWFETREVIDYEAGGVLHVEDEVGWPAPEEGWGFYMDNRFEELDSAGEWYLDTVGMKVYLFPPGSADPNDLLVEGSYLSSGLSVGGSNVENVCFRQQTGTGLQITGNTTVSGCRFEHIENSALQGTWDARDAVVSRCVFMDNLNVAVSWNENPASASSSLMEYDTLINTGTVPGYGGEGSWHAAGIIVSNASDLHIQYCYIDNTGYAGIILGSDGNFTEYNIIKGAMSTLNDGAAIYTNCSRSTIRYNILLNVEGDLESSGPWSNLGHGIWPEFLSDFRENLIEHNTAAYCGAFGLFLPNNFDCVVRNNVFYGNGRAQMEIEGMESNSSTGRTQNLPQNHIIEGNVLCSDNESQRTLLFRPEYDYGTLSSNYYCNPFTESVIGEWDNWNILDRTIAQWQGSFSWADNSAKTDVIRRPSGLAGDNHYGLPRLIINDSPEFRNIDIGAGRYLDLDGNEVASSVGLDPFTSMVLIVADSTTLPVRPGQEEHAGSGLRIDHGPHARLSITYHVDSRYNASINIFDMSGRRIKSLACGIKEPGEHRAIWDGRDNTGRLVSAGIYICELAVEGKRSQERKRFVFVR